MEEDYLCSVHNDYLLYLICLKQSQLFSMKDNIINHLNYGDLAIRVKANSSLVVYPKDQRMVKSIPIKYNKKINNANAE